MDVSREVNNIREAIDSMAQLQPETVFLASIPSMGAVTFKANSRGDDNHPPPPASSIEQIIAAAWAEVLAVPQVDRKANFFALGGDALLAIQCVTKLREKLPIIFSLADFFENSTVTEQAELVRQHLRPANGTGSRELVDPSANWDQTLLQQYERPDPSLPHPLSPAQQRLANASFAEDLSFWEETLRGAPALLELPADRARPAIATYRGGRLRRKLSRPLTEALREMSRQEKASLLAVFAAALDTLLFRYTGCEDILLGIPLADRDQQELRSVVGFLLQTHVLRTKLSGDMTFRDLLSRVQEGMLDLHAHRGVPFDQIVQKLHPDRNLSYSPLFQVMLNWRDRDQQLPFYGLKGLTVESLPAATNTSKFDLYLSAIDHGDEIWLEMEYSTDLFDEDRVERMLGHYQVLLEAVAVDAGQRLDVMPLVTDAERQQLLMDWNDTASEYPRDVSLARLVEEQVERTPDAVAVTYEDGVSITYRGLNDRANQLAHELRKHGAGPDQLIGMCVERSIDMIAALLAIIKAGAAYVPIDPDLPPERLAYMIEDSGLRILLTQKTLRSSLPPLKAKVIEVDSLGWQANSRENPDVAVKPENLAHIIYTSGSTGRPKGVKVPRAALINLLWYMRELLQLKSNDALLAVTTISFDIAGVDVWLPLLTGARSVIASRSSAADGQRLRELIERHQIKFLQATPTTWRLLLAAGWEGKQDLTAVCTGEAMPRELAAQLRPAVARLWNLYGPTETTIWSTAWMVKKDDEPVLIGRPVANTQCYLLDGAGQPVPVGIAGELYIAGDGLASGYLNLPDLTDEKFVPNPFAPGTRMYRTGDLARYRPDGNIECLGRNDFQVKIRGFRIELGEIEAVLEQQKGVAQCAVLAQIGDWADKRLVAYIVPSDTKAVPAVEDLRGALKVRLPDYMIPSAFVVIESMPLTPNGKIDRKALSVSDFKAIASATPVEPPRDSVEAKLVKIWERVLEVRPIGIRTDFFDVGGYSLMVIKLFAQINKAFDRSLPIATIFQAPTIEQLATLIRGRTVNETALVPIRPKGSKKPLFIVHSYLTYERFRRITDPERRLFGLHEREDDSERIASVGDRVAEYVRQIRDAEPEGPYFLIGWCAAGPLTIELARELQNCGGQVQMLGLIDSENPDYASELSQQRSRRSISDRIVDMIRFHRKRRVQLAYSGGTIQYAWSVLCDRLSDIWRRLLLRYWKQVSPLCRLLGISAPHSEDNMSTVGVESVQPYEGRITLFRPVETTDSLADPTLGWREVALQGIDIVWTPGDHETMFIEPNVGVFGQQLEEVLEKQSYRVDPDLMQSQDAYDKIPQHATTVSGG
jgi:amino acid adenylation domain-containing protein